MEYITTYNFHLASGNVIQATIKNSKNPKDFMNRFYGPDYYIFWDCKKEVPVLIKSRHVSAITISTLKPRPTGTPKTT